MNTQIYQEASEWLIELRTEEPGHAARKRFQAWLSRSPEHVQAYLELSGVWETIGTRSPADPQDIDDLIERARAATNVAPFASLHGAPRWSGRPNRRAFLASAATLLLVMAGMGAYLSTQRHTYATDIGEQRSILLKDGSTIDLNARSKVRVRFAEGERHVYLLEGQALFRVAKDSTRPFIVEANDTRVRAVGTQFDVNHRRRSLIVTVVEGTVAVSSASDEYDASRHIDAQAPEQVETSPASSAKNAELLLRAGEQAVLRSSVPVLAQRADIVTATAWTQRRLIFSSTSLEDVAEEFNRNSTRPLIVEGKGLDDFHISGAFSSTDPQPLLRFLRAQTGIEVIEHSDRIVVSKRE